ncbi:hypothetical protein NA56DRAFT_705705 [Hyaloscypha hepaticicola]|uniref:Heterokaryon incompatibility domain-containing protein n=1 Tax=Hyaloscypha hepaticicola TaxID=2082293 RepID=A0A2J6Q003_9HELO|nr:hypothetical protein NA56DRAFT_705705 [Hyaloscypha hepaticicola]
MLKQISKALWSLGSGQWRCGVCLFELDFGIRPLEIDIVGRNGAESVFWTSDYHEVSFIEAFDIFHASFVNAQWWPGRSGERPRLVLGQSQQCGAKEVGFRPTRLLFLGDKVQNIIRLVENEASCPVYAALSHRWSEETQQVRLKHRNIAQRRKDGISLREFPPMMQDAISDDKGDWEAEAATMASVYANAELTLAATWCAGSGQSLFRDDSGNHNSTFDITEKNGVSIFLRPVWPHYMERDAEEGLLAEAEWPLLTRAWVYQEQFLSRRTLHFTRHELFWACNKVLDCQNNHEQEENGRRYPTLVTPRYQRSKDDQCKTVQNFSLSISGHTSIASYLSQSR